VQWPGAGTAPTWSDLAVVPQALGLLDELTVAENVTLPIRLRDGGVDADARARVEELLDALGVSHVGSHQPSEASVGEQQRGAIARALVVAPTVLLLDEPTAHQDAASKKRIVDAVTAAARSGTAVLAATHDSAVLDIADRRIRLADGRLR
jgi:putative ABC transport system ATP-binding protein